MATTDPSGEELQRAWELHQQEQYGDAEAIYRKVLAATPRHAVALFLLGRLELDQGRNELAAEHLSAAVESDASQAVFHATLARAQRALGRVGRAVESYRQAVDLAPDNADYYVNLGNALLARKEATEAAACYKKAIELDPQLPEAYTCLGAVLEHQGQLEEAEAQHRKAIALRPKYAEAHHNLGTVLLRLDKAEEALECFRTATEEKPDWDAPWANLGAVHYALGNDDEAWRCVDRALELAPRFADNHVSRAKLLADQGRWQEALDAYEEALTLDPKNVGAWYGRALVNLSLGRFAEGWAGFEHRSQVHPSRSLQLPRAMVGRFLGDQTLLVHAEWGLGDTIQFIRLVKRLELSKVVLAVQPELMTLLAESGFDNVVSREELPEFDVQIPLMSLPRILQIELEDIPSEVPYLSVRDDRVARWREALAPHRGFRVGVAWQDNARHRLDRARTIPPVHLSALAEVPGVELIGLQQDEPGRPSLRDAMPCKIAFLDELAGPDALLDTAAVMMNLDLVVVSDSVLAHLAGALGVPVWVALAKPASWRWLVDREDSPWYPTMRLFRQETRGNWSEVFARMAESLKELVRQREDAG